MRLEGQKIMSALPPKADIGAAQIDVRSGHKGTWPLEVKTIRLKRKSGVDIPAAFYCARFPFETKDDRTLAGACPLWINSGPPQNGTPFRINRPTKTAVSDRPNSFVVARSLVFVITSFPAFRFFAFSRARLERSWTVAPAYRGSLQL